MLPKDGYSLNVRGNYLWSLDRIVFRPDCVVTTPLVMRFTTSGGQPLGSSLSRRLSSEGSGWGAGGGGGRGEVVVGD